MYGTLMYGTLKSWRIDLRSAPQSPGGWAGIAKQQTEECTQDSRGGGG